MLGSENTPWGTSILIPTSGSFSRPSHARASAALLNIG